MIEVESGSVYGTKKGISDNRRAQSENTLLPEYSVLKISCVQYIE